MPISTLTPLNGAEIKKMTKLQLEKEVDALAYLREGNSFKQAVISFGFTMTCFPADCPVPEREIEFELRKFEGTFEELERQVQLAENLAQSIESLEALRNNVDKLLDEALTARGKVVTEHEFEKVVDSTTPDKVRLENDLPIPVLEVRGGKHFETKIPAAEFKKVAKP